MPPLIRAPTSGHAKTSHGSRGDAYCDSPGQGACTVGKHVLESVSARKHHKEYASLDRPDRHMVRFHQIDPQNTVPMIAIERRDRINRVDRGHQLS